jgi:hypothetical protein
MTGATLTSKLKSAYPEATIFGVGDYDSSREDVSVIGMRRDTKWRVYAQVHPGGTRRIDRVVQFF